MRKAARAQFDMAKRVGARFVIDGATEFPPSLHALESVPTHLWMLGDPATLEKPMVSIVGTREMTAYGERVTRAVSNAFARNGFVIVSGMARGIDSVAHNAAIEAGTRTVAVLGTGVDVAYPVANRPLHRRIREHGVVISDAPMGAHAHKGSFPQRNRLIAALGRATIVVEAGVKSGALITADWADSIGRPVGITPGPIDSPSCLGSNLRLRDGGGHCIASVEDALQLVGISEPGKISIEFETGTERTIWNALERPVANFDVLIARTGLPARLCLETITALELRGIVDCAMTGEIRRRC